MKLKTQSFFSIKGINTNIAAIMFPKNIIYERIYK